MPHATPRERVEARIAPLLPPGWVLDEPHLVDGGWQLGIHSTADPLVSKGRSHADFERAISQLVDAMADLRPRN